MNTEFQNAENKKMDVRLLTLKRWNFPQSNSVLSLKNSDAFISYQNYHVINIEKLENPDGKFIAPAYDRLKDLRKEQRKADSHVHMIQNIAVIGEETSFWEEKTDVIYITFIQLVNVADAPLRTIVQEIDQTVKSELSGRAVDGRQPSWALYYSLDYCDLVLFTKDIRYGLLQDILWKLALVRSDSLWVIRDYFTIYSFRQAFLKKAFEKICKKEETDWLENIMLAVDLSIQSADTWIEFEKQLNREKIPHQVKRVSGRYDVQVMTGALSGGEILKILYMLDKLTAKGTDEFFCGYEVAFLADRWECPSAEECRGSKQDRELEEAVKSMAERFFSIPEASQIKAVDYIAETIQSLLAVFKNGFSEGFAVSVLLSFAAFLRITLKSREYADADEMQDVMTRFYFGALNTLANSVMHNDRQFIQVSTFNASYFDVPPKLAAFYTVMAYEIVNSARVKGDSCYRFIISPDYREDINVRSLEINVRDNFEEHLAIIYLCEEYFYNPSDTIKLLCHEIGHYEGNRCREKRVKYMFQAISYQLLSLTLSKLCGENGLDSGTGVIELLSEELAEFMIKCLNSQKREYTRGIKYHLKDISDFLEGIEYGFGLFEDGKWREEILLRWRNILVDHIKKSKDTRKELRRWMRELQTSFLLENQEGQFGPENGDEAAYDVLARQLIFEIRDARFRWSSENFSISKIYLDYCENAIQAFSESFADLQMKKLMGEMFDIQYYKCLLEKIGDGTSLQQILRKAAVLGEKPIGNDAICYTICKISEYLEECKPEMKKSDLVVEALKKFQKEDAGKQFEFMYDNIAKYRKILINYCRETLKKK